MIGGRTADQIRYVFLQFGVGYALFERTGGEFGLMSEAVQHKNRFRMDQIRDFGLDFSCTDWRRDFHQVTVTDAEFRGPKQDLRWHGVEESALHAMFDLLNAGPGRRERWLSLQPV